MGEEGKPDTMRQGNEAFRRKEFSLAVAFFTEALENESDPHVLALLLSNRSATYAQLNLFDLALKVAHILSAVKPDESSPGCGPLYRAEAQLGERKTPTGSSLSSVVGWLSSLQAIAFMGLSNYDEATRSYSKALVARVPAPSVS